MQGMPQSRQYHDHYVYHSMFPGRCEQRGSVPIAGMMLSTQFPINYFSVSEVEQWFSDFGAEFSDCKKALPGDDRHWRFNRLHDYVSGFRGS